LTLVRAEFVASARRSGEGARDYRGRFLDL
jgi:hypothetical protein